MKGFILTGCITALSVIQLSAQTNKERLFNPDQQVNTQGTESFFYVLQQSTATYQDLQAPDFMLNQVWDDPFISLEFPFSTTFAGMGIDSLTMSLGSILLGSSISNDDLAVFAPMGVDLVDRGAISGTPSSPISYKVEGTAPNRIFKMEWKNAGLYYELDATNTTNSYVNVQLWIYEDEKIEFRYGDHNLTAALVTALNANEEMFSGFATYDWDLDSNMNVHLLYGSASAPILADTLTQLTSWPSNGTVYTLQLPGVSVEENSGALRVKLYPNPAHNELRVRCDADKSYQVTLIDLSGQVVGRGALSMDNSLDLSHLPRGLYMAKMVESGSGLTEVHKLIVE